MLRAEREERDRLEADRIEKANEAARMQARERDLMDAKTVFVYGRRDHKKTADVEKALRQASVPFESRDFDADKRYLEPLTQSGFDSGWERPTAPIICYGMKAWWDNFDLRPGGGMFDIPFESTVAMELRSVLGIKAQPVDTSKTMPIRTDADIDTEIAERYTTMQQAFLSVDYDQDGLITVSELRAKCKEWNIPLTEAQRAIDEADTNKDGCLDFDEFAKRFNSYFVNRANNGRGAYRGAAQAPMTYSKLGSPQDEDGKHSRARKERKGHEDERVERSHRISAHDHHPEAEEDGRKPAVRKSQKKTKRHN